MSEERLRKLLTDPSTMAMDLRLGGLPVRLRTRLEPPADASEVEEHCPGAPQEMLSLWAVARSAEVLVDRNYGQTGLRLFSPPEAREHTERLAASRTVDVLPRDLVCGEVVGAGQQLMASGGDILAVNLLDARVDWQVVGTSLLDFLSRYVGGRGAEFWNSEPARAE